MIIRSITNAGKPTIGKVIAVITSVLLACLAISSIAVEAQSVESFHFGNFEADYYLSKDEDGRSELRVVEQLTAEFPEYDQNKGIIRAIPIAYEGRPVSFELESLKRNGQEEPVYDKSTENGNVLISTGTDNYIHGTQTYEITYSVRDVTRDFGEYQEFFWDTNGTQWRQVFEQLEARVHLDQGVRGLFTSDVLCFEGPEGATAKCDWRIDGDTIIFKSSRSLLPRENVSMLMKFEPGAFEPYDEGAAGVARRVIALLSLGFIVSAIVLGTNVWLRNRAVKSRGVIVPEYLPPKDMSVILAAHIYGENRVLKKSIAAQIIDLAVRHKIKVMEDTRRRFLLNSTSYSIELQNSQDLNYEETSVLKAFFKGKKQPGARYDFSTSGSTTGLVIQSLHKDLKEKVITTGYRRKAAGVLPPYLLAILAIAISFGLFIEMSSKGFSGDWRSMMFLPVLGGLGLIALMLKTGPRPLTDKGRQVVDYLKGLQMYMKLAETDRLRMLQSPTGAQKTPIDTSDTKQIVKLYEKLLPYAVLFNLEKEWSKQLSVYYEEGHTTPNWYAGAHGFNAGAFSSSVSSFSTSTSSSSSGFSGGGGSGGGGGGGGGGGR